MDPETVARIRAAHSVTVTWWGCAVQLTCLTCRIAYPCLAIIALEERFRLEQKRGNVGRPSVSAFSEAGLEAETLS
ncbi:hypothetical protein HC028_16675 [Planosporangium flavigriseum]|uniref:Uncharacterized protein n=1 Tax=Planosporangium flavigriseum TaxID=373681 RepID=A0A8J3PM55_9ACTN|nr:hypothetical protein [Planosporangium flavigriseum]NJC66126.1 hypothetical protein [Planosporangium flavigriseum]GIG75181.1 hypothetical protein Pfl04_35850 [Planosporangium flavigriseum]